MATKQTVTNASTIAAQQATAASNQAKATAAQAAATAAKTSSAPIVAKAQSGISATQAAINALSAVVNSKNPTTAQMNALSAATSAAKKVNAAVTAEDKTNLAGYTQSYNTAMADYNTYSAPVTIDNPIYATTYIASDGKEFTDAAAYQAYESGLAQKATDAAAKKSAVELFRASLTEYGLADLAVAVDDMIKNDYSVAQIKLELPKTDAYVKRFPGMQALKDAGKAITEAAYISTEKSYDTVLRAHGLDTNVFGTTQEYGKYIAKEVAPLEFENRVSIASDRVNKNPDVLAALNNYYGVSKGTAISYLLNPELGIDLVQKEARAAEIGAAAAASNFNFGEGQTGAGVAESFIASTGTTDLTGLKTEFGKARNLADTQVRLSQIEGTNFKDLDAVTAVINQDQRLLLESQKRAARESARFSGSTGIGSASLKTGSEGNI
jgi:hypothetical protein